MTENEIDPKTKKKFEETFLEDFEKVLHEQKDSEGKALAPSLGQNWKYLQVYANYGLILPGTKAQLKLYLTISKPAKYEWFEAMAEAFGGIQKACEVFLNDVFFKVVDLGNNLKNYSDDAGGGERSVFNVVLSCLYPEGADEEDPEAALELLEDMRKQAIKNHQAASKVSKDLATFKSDLVKWDHALEEVKKSVNKDEQVSQKTINRLEGEEDEQTHKHKPGSVEKLQEKLRKDKKELIKDLVALGIAAELSCVWWPLPPLPVGLVPGAVVGGIYGTKLIKLIDDMKKLERLIKNAKKELRIARATHSVYSLAKDSLSSSIRHTNVAIEKTNSIQNEWSKADNGLEYIMEKIQNMIKQDTSGEDKLKNKRLIKHYLEKSTDSWTKIKPIIEAATHEPFIVVDKEKMTVDEYKAKVQKEINEAKQG